MTSDNMQIHKTKIAMELHVFPNQEKEIDWNFVTWNPRVGQLK